MQPAPLAGTATSNHNLLGLLLSRGCNPHPSRGRQLYPRTILLSLYHAMQPAPLAGTATPPPASKVSFFYRCSPRPLRGRQPTPGNVALKCACRMQPAPLTGTTTHGPRRFHTGAHQQDATRTPRGDGNRNATTSSGLLRAMQPAPLAGTATFARRRVQQSFFDATRTPRGDGN